MALAHFKRIADATDLPLIAFQYPLATGQGYPKDTLLRMCDEVPTMRAIKDWANNVPQHEWHVRTLQSAAAAGDRARHASAWLMSSLVLGCNGLLSGSGSVIPDLQARLFRAVQANDLAEPRRRSMTASTRWRSVFYADPAVDMHNRMKEALVLLGRLPRAVVRPPLVKIERAEIERIRKALVEAEAVAAAGRARRVGWITTGHLSASWRGRSEAAQSCRSGSRLGATRCVRSYTGLASISTKAMQHGCSVRLLQAWLVPRWINTSPALSSTSPSSISA